MTTLTNTVPANNGETRPLWQLLFGWIDRPGATFKAVLARRRWWMWAAPLLVTTVALAVMTVVIAPYTLELAREQAEAQLASLPAEQADMARSQMEGSLTLPVMMTSTLVSGIIFLVIGVLAQATFLYFGALVSGGEVNFGPVFTVSAWTQLPFALGFLAQAGYTAFTQQFITSPGLSFLVSTGKLMQDSRSPLFGLLSRIDLFWAWHILLIVVGLAVAARFGRGKALVLAVLYAVLALAIGVLPTILFSGMVPG